MRTVTVALGVSMAVALMAAPATAENRAATPTFNKDVAPILFRSCAGCHRPNQIAPMALLSYQNVRPWARVIKNKVRAREMPPWFADPNFGKHKFRNDPSLTDAEIETITAWVDAGAPQGDGTAPPVPQFADDAWRHPSGRAPDFVVEFPADIHVPSVGEMPNFSLYSPLPLNERRLVSATQVLPGNVAATHHIGVNLSTLPPGKVIGRGAPWPGGPVTDYMAVPAKDGEKVQVSELSEEQQRELRDAAGGAGTFAFYVPGLGAKVMPPGLANQAFGDRARYVSWGVHYQPTGRPETARPKLGLWFANESEVRNLERRAAIEEQTQEGKPVLRRPLPPRDPRESPASTINPFLDPIPPNEADWTTTGVAVFQDDVTIHELFLHMHARGRDVTYVLTYPDGTEEVILRVKNYDFDWQLPYEFAQPFKVPAGTTLKGIAVYDNSVKNRRNPAPHRPVYWSEQSWDDMFLTDVRFSVDRLAKNGRTTQAQD